MRFRKKPIVIEAEQFLLGETQPEGVVAVWVDMFDPDVVICAASKDVAPKSANMAFGIRTAEGWHVAKHGDWIITGIKGERYPCKPDIFAATYEQVTEEEDPVWLPGLPNISPGNLSMVSSDAEWIYIDDRKTITAIPRQQFFEFIEPLMTQDDDLTGNSND